jgi:ArsR family transcriptional regulator
MNISDYNPNYKKMADLFALLAQPSRLKILLLIGDREICVCNLMATLGYRQAYISQQLMGLREAGFVKTRRQGRSIYYSMTDPGLLKVIESASNQMKLPLPKITIEEIAGCAINLEPIKP